MNNNINSRYSNSPDMVLIVDDTATNHDVIRAFLKDIDVCCDSVFDGMEAITACNCESAPEYSLILMDINLPHMSGFDTASTLRSMGITAPIVAVTAYGESDLETMGAESIFDSILYKPFNSDGFFSSISPYIRNASSCSLGTKSTLKGTDSNANQHASLPDIDAQICNVSQGIANMGSSTRLFMKHLSNFKKNNADLALRMRTLISNEDYEECAVLCHSIKGLSGMLGLTALYEHVITMEDLLNKIHYESNARDVTLDIISLIGNDIRLICQLQL